MKQGEKLKEEERSPKKALGPAMVSAAMRMLFLRQLTVDVFSTCDVPGEEGKLLECTTRNPLL